jgi:hypothetical protein
MQLLVARLEIHDLHRKIAALRQELHPPAADPNCHEYNASKGLRRTHNPHHHYICFRNSRATLRIEPAHRSSSHGRLPLVPTPCSPSAPLSTSPPKISLKQPIKTVPNGFRNSTEDQRTPTGKSCKNYEEKQTQTEEIEGDEYHVHCCKE